MSIICSLARVKELRQNAQARKNSVDVDVDLTDDGQEPCSSQSQEVPTKQAPPPRSETGLGVLDYEAATQAFNEADNSSRGKYYKYSDEQRFQIAKHVSEFGMSSTLKKYKGHFPNLNESTVRSMRKKYDE